MKLSIDGERTIENATLDNIVDSEESSAERNTKLERTLMKASKGLVRSVNKVGSVDKTEENINSSKLPMLRRRQHIFVIAVDDDTDTDLIKTIKQIFDATSEERMSGSVGYVLSSALTISEVHSIIVSGGIPATDFDAFICNSGSELYYPSSNSDDMLSSSELPYELDADYHSQIEYRWGGDGLRKTLIRWAGSIVNTNGDGEEKVVTEDEQRSAAYCYAFRVKDPALVNLLLPSQFLHSATLFQ